MPAGPRDPMQLLHDAARGDEAAASRLLPLVYDELRRLAGSYLRAERPDHTLQPTALVHEAYLRLVGSAKQDWESRVHFFATAARQMRRILIDHARKKRSAKRGGGLTRITLSDDVASSPGASVDLLALDDALEDLARDDPRRAQAVELQSFGGMTEAEIAALLGVSRTTIQKDLLVARAKLARMLDSVAPGI